MGVDIRLNNPRDRRAVGAQIGPNVPIQQIELRHLRYVVAISEELHFARAADRLHLAAPSLSKQVRQLERLLGYPLFERGTRHVVLTKAGSVFVAEAGEALNHVVLALNLSAAASGAGSATVVVGYSPWIDLAWIIEARDLLGGETVTEVMLRSECSALQVENLLTGRLSAGILILPVKTTGLNVQALRRERLLLALPENHALAKPEAVTFKALAGEPFISMADSTEPALNEYLRRIGEESGFAPNVIHEVTNIAEALELVASRMGTALVRASAAARLHAHGVVFRECAELELFVEVGLAYRIQHPPPAVERLISLLQQIVNENP